LQVVRWARGLQDKKVREDALEKLLETLAIRDPEGALAFARLHAPELLPEDKLPDWFAKGLKNADPQEAAERFARFGDAGNMAHVVGRWAAKDREAAMKWADALDDAKQRQEALSSVFSIWSEKEFSAALAAFDRTKRDGANLSGTAGQFVERWPANDLSGLQKWAGRLEEGPEQTEAYRRLGYRFSRADLDGGAKWLESLPKGEARDGAIEQFAMGAVEKDGAAALQWALSVGDADKRRDAMKRVTQEWFRVDAAAAFEWLQHSTDMTAEEKRRVLSNK